MGIEPASSPRPRAFAPRRMVPLAALVAAIIAVFAFRPDRYLSFEQLAANREWLLAEVQRLGILAPVLFAVIYAVATGLSIPGATILTLTAGFLFGTPVGTIVVVVGATLGATIVFLIARTAFGDALRARAGPFIRKLEAGFRENALSYLLVLRLVPLFPFWLVNIVPAFLGVRLSTFVIATFVGIIPGAVVYASLGGGLGALIERGERPDLGIIFEPRVFGPLLGLALLALLPAGPVPPPEGRMAGRMLGDLPAAARGTLGADDAAAIRDVTWQPTLPPAVPVPTLLVVGDRDPLLPPAAARMLAAAVGAEQRVVEGAGHWPHLGPTWSGVVTLVHRWLVQRLGEPLLETYAEAMAEREADDDAD